MKTKKEIYMKLSFASAIFSIGPPMKLESLEPYLFNLKIYMNKHKMKVKHAQP